MDRLRDHYWELPLDSLTRAEWEGLCDGCGQCCLHKLEVEDTGEVLHTNVACRLLDTKTARCRDYTHRKIFVPDCVRLSPRNIRDVPWLPETCAYRRRADGKPLPAWHYLLTGDPGSVHTAGASVAGRVVSEEDAGPLEHHIIATTAPWRP